MKLDAGKDTTVSLGTKAILFAQCEGEHIQWQWTSSADVGCPDCPETQATIWRNTRFLVSATDTMHHCVATDTIFIKVVCPIDVPNLVTLNGDQWNEYFYLKHQTCLQKIIRLQVFDRWGKQMLDKKDFPEGYDQAAWQPQLAGVYFYHLEVDLFEGESASFTGWIEVLK